MENFKNVKLIFSEEKCNFFEVKVKVKVKDPRQRLKRWRG